MSEPFSFIARRGRRDSSDRRRGIALIMVLWVLVLIALVAAALRATVEAEIHAGLARTGQAQAMAAADGGVYWAIERLLERVYVGTTSDRPPVPIDDRPLVADFGDGVRAEVRIQDVGGLVDLNAAPRPLLAALIHRLGVAADRADVLAGRIMDFRDLDSEPQPRGGAEDEAYARAHMPFGPKNGPFDSPDELAQVLGIGFDLAARMKPYVTVMSGARGIDPLVAPPLVLEALPGLSDAARRLLLAERSRAGALRRTMPQVRHDMFQPSTHANYRIVSIGIAPDGARFIRESVVQIRGSRQPPYFFRSWTQRLSIPVPPES
ncbi:MAG: general secretion pathway protein GspK [Alphaproteobacteria bacterium]|nr:MAG: general secretion pathway protein GspK [Alphaproteobacteria bacterium]